MLLQQLIVLLFVRSEFAAADSSAAATNLAARTVIANGLATEIAERIAAVSAEAGTRAAADTTLQGNIDSEAARIDAMLNLSTADADSFKEIVDLINSVDTVNDNAFGTYVAANDAALAAAISNSDAADAAEEAARIAADGVLTTAVGAEATRALAAEAALVQDILDENARAIAAEAVLTAGITAENAAMLAAVAAQNTAMLAAVNVEKLRAEDVETILSDDHALEVTARIAGDTALQGALDVEIASSVVRFNEAAGFRAAIAQDLAAYEASNNAALANEVAATNADFITASNARAAIQSDVDANEAAATTDRAAIRTEMAGMDLTLTTSINEIEAGALKVTLLDEASADMSGTFTHFIVDSNVAKAFSLPMMQEGSFIAIKVARGGSAITFNAAMGENIDGEDDNSILAHPGVSLKLVKKGGKMYVM